MLRPLGDHVVLKAEEEREQTVDGFIPVGASKKKTQVATVVAVGDSAHTLTGKLVAPNVAAGDKVIIESGARIKVKDNDDTVAIIRETDILTILA